MGQASKQWTDTGPGIQAATIAVILGATAIVIGIAMSFGAFSPLGPVAFLIGVPLLLIGIGVRYYYHHRGNPLEGDPRFHPTEPRRSRRRRG